jgi:hypothetical protein
MQHTVRTGDGKTRTLEPYFRSTAIKAYCTECLGFEGHAKDDCTSPLCPLYPYRGRLTRTLRADAAPDPSEAGDVAWEGVD